MERRPRCWRSPPCRRTHTGRACSSHQRRRHRRLLPGRKPPARRALPPDAALGLRQGAGDGMVPRGEGVGPEAMRARERLVIRFANELTRKGLSRRRAAGRGPRRSLTQIVTDGSTDARRLLQPEGRPRRRAAACERLQRCVEAAGASEREPGKARRPPVSEATAFETASDAPPRRR